jgi:CRP-like cAMP-binding protein
LWESGYLSRAILVVFAVVVAGPILRALIDAGRSLTRVVHRWTTRIRFRLETSWRVEAAELLDQSGLFDDLEVDVLNELAGRVTRRSVSAGAAVITQGERASSLYVIRQGSVAVSERDMDTGQEHPLRTMGRGQVFGELGLFSNAPRSATVRATTACELFELAEGVFDHLLADALLPPTFGPSLQDLEELRHIDCFANLSTTELVRVQSNGEWVQFAPGDTIVRRGETADSFYGLRTGQVEVLEGRRVVNTLGPGAWFGERGLLLNSTRTATVRARTPVRVFRLDRRGFDDLLRAAFRSGRVGSHRLEHRTWEH